MLQLPEYDNDLVAVLVRFKPHQRGGGCCSTVPIGESVKAKTSFQTPSAGRWVLQQLVVLRAPASPKCWFQTPSAGRWVLQLFELTLVFGAIAGVSNPISGEVGAAAGSNGCGWQRSRIQFQTPSAGRWVLQHDELDDFDYSEG